MYWSFKMGFVRDTLGITDAKSLFLGGKADILDLGGVQGEKSAIEASEAAEVAELDALDRAQTETRRSTEEAQGFLAPFGDVGVAGTEQAGFLTDPQAQFDFVKNNPLFQIGLDNANRQTSQLAAARCRLSSGDTLQQLNQNALLTASPLIQQQKQSIGDLFSIGRNAALNQGNILTGTAANQGNLLTGAAAAQAGGLIGAENARVQGQENLFNLGGQLAGFLGG